MPNEDLWHQRMGHVSYKQLSIVSKEAVFGISKLVKVDINVVCGPCQLGKQTRSHHQATLTTATTRPLKLLQIDFIGPTIAKSLGGEKYIMIVVDDFTIFTWAILLLSRSEAPQQIEILCKRLQNEKGVSINHLQSDHGRGFENSQLEEFSLKWA